MGVKPFPVKALDAVNRPDLELVLAVLVWRAEILEHVEWGHDIIMPRDQLEEWETLWAFEDFLRPAGAERLCSFCLTEFRLGRAPASRHACLVYARRGAVVEAEYEAMNKLNL
jgi:hypothetical protein